MSLLIFHLYAYGVNYSTYPFAPATKILAVDIGGKADGMATQLRIAYKYDSQIMIEGGLGVATSNNDNASMFVGIDYEVIPDYLKQPRIGVRVAVDNVNFSGSRHNIFSMTTVVSKGVSFWGREAFPYISLPLGMAFNTANKTYSTYLALSAGVTGNLPINKYHHLVTNLEASLGFTGLGSSIFAGISFPFKENLVFKD
jgi:hypothetical protein